MFIVYALAYLSDIELCYVQIRIKMSESCLLYTSDAADD